MMPAEITALLYPTWHNVSDLYDTETHLNLSMLYQRKKHKKEAIAVIFGMIPKAF